ncbi:MAG: YybH family protein [Bacteroidota bacterium]
MRTSFFPFLVIGICLALASCAPPERINEEQLRGEIEAFFEEAAEHWNSEDLEAWLSDYAPDPVILADGQRWLSDPDSIKAAFAKHFEEASELNWKPEIVQVYFPSSRAAVAVLEWTYSFVQDGKTIESPGVETYYLVKDEARWKVQHEHWSYPPQTQQEGS